MLQLADQAAHLDHGEDGGAIRGAHLGGDPRQELIVDLLPLGQARGQGDAARLGGATKRARRRGDRVAVAGAQQHGQEGGEFAQRGCEGLGEQGEGSEALALQETLYVRDQHPLGGRGDERFEAGQEGGHGGVGRVGGWGGGSHHRLSARR